MKRYFLNRHGRASVKSSVETVGRRRVGYARRRSPEIVDRRPGKAGAPFVERREHPLPGSPSEPRTIRRWGTSVGLSEFSFGRMIGFLKLPKN